MVPDNGEVATTVAGSPAHNAWVSGDSGAAAPAAPAAPATPTTPAAAPSDKAAPATPAALPTDMTRQRPDENAGRIHDKAKDWLGKHKDADRASKTASAAPASPADKAAPAVVAGAVAAGEAAEAAAKAAGATPAQAAAAGDKAAEEFLEAVGPDGQPFKIPLGVKIPIKRNGKIEHVSIAEAQKSTMMEADYRHKTAALGQDRRALAAEQARMKAQQEQIEADRKMVEEAQLDPEKWEQYQEHLNQLKNNPYYRANWEKGRNAELDRAELNAFHAEEEHAVVRSAAETVEQTLNSLATDYPGVDIASVRREYANALQEGRAELTEASLRSFFKREADAVTRYTGPLTKQIEELKATVESLAKAKQEETAATTHNEQTRRAIDRDNKGRFTSPAGGTSPDVTRDPPPKPFTSHELPSRIKGWVDRGRGELRR